MTFRLGDIVTNFDRQRIPLSSSERQQRQGEFRYYGAQGVIDHINSYIFDGEYLLVAEDGENVKSQKNNIAQIVNGQFWVNNHAHVLQSNGLCDLRLLCYVLNRTDISGYVTGSAQPKLTQANLNAIELDLPALEIQHTIADTLSTLDARIAENKKINHHLEQMAQAIFKSWFVDFEPFGGVMPDDWRGGTISEIAESVYSGGTPNTGTTSFWGGDIPWLSSGETKNHFIIATEKTITQSGVDNSSTRLAHRFDVVMASAGQGLTRGQTSLLLFDSYVNQSVIVIHSDYPFFLFLNLSGRYEELRAISDSNSIRGSITTKMLAQFPILLPSKTALSEFSAILEPLFEQIECNLRENVNLADLRNALLPRLMSGELSVADYAAK